MGVNTPKPDTWSASWLLWSFHQMTHCLLNPFVSTDLNFQRLDIFLLLRLFLTDQPINVHLSWVNYTINVTYLQLLIQKGLQKSRYFIFSIYDKNLSFFSATTKVFWIWIKNLHISDWEVKLTRDSFLILLIWYIDKLALKVSSKYSIMFTILFQNYVSVSHKIKVSKRSMNLKFGNISKILE